MTDESHPEVVDIREPPAPGTVIRKVTPWLVLAVLLFAVANMFSQYRSAQLVAERSTTPTAAVTPGPASTSGSGGGTGSATTTPAPKAPTVVVLIDGVNFRETPQNSSKVIEALNRDAKLTWVATQGNWYKARDQKGRVGYISANASLTQKR